MTEDRTGLVATAFYKSPLLEDSRQKRKESFRNLAIFMQIGEAELEAFYLENLRAVTTEILEYYAKKPLPDLHAYILESVKILTISG